MSFKVIHSKKPGISVGFTANASAGTFKGAVRGDLCWCSAIPERVDLLLSGNGGGLLSKGIPKWSPISAELEAFAGGQLTARVSLTLPECKVTGSVDPWLKLTGSAAGNVGVLLGVEGCATGMVLYDPIRSGNLVLIAGVVGGGGLTLPFELGSFFARVGLRVEAMGELFIFVETLVAPDKSTRK